MLHKCHKYRQPTQKVSHKKTERLPLEAFQPKASDESIGFNAVSSTTQQTSWYSPGAPNLPVSSSDVSMTTHCHALQQFCNMCTSWQGLICQVHHQLVFCKKNAPQWKFLCHGHFKDSMALVWPVDIKHMGAGSGLQLVIPHDDVQKPTLIHISSLVGWDWWHDTWMSYHGVLQKYPKVRAKLSPGTIFSFVCVPCWCALVVVGFLVSSAVWPWLMM